MRNDPLCDPADVKRVGTKLPLAIYRAVYRIKPTEALNCDPRPSGQGAPGAQADLAARLRQTINAIRADGIDPDTGKVAYTRLGDSDAFAHYRAAVRALHRFDPATLPSEDERKAFWINLYNALIIHAVIAYRAKDSIREIPGVFERAAYIVGGYRYSVDDIEHGVLRANRGHPFIPGARFGRADPRRAFALQKLDPRIHFTLNCGATSCPPVGFYNSLRLDDQLDTAAQHFLADGGLILQRESGVVRVSRLLSWYAADFGGALYGYRNQAAILRTILPWVADEEDRAYIEAHAARLPLTFLPYDWSLNV